MKKKLNWAQIVDLYPGEWVQLTDYQWNDFEAHPKSGVVRLHSASKRYFNKLILKHPRAKNSALVLVPGLQPDDSLCLYPGVIEKQYAKTKDCTERRSPHS